MPIYEYVCETCGSEFEVMRKFSDPELTSHECGPHSKVRRKLSLTAFHLQGGGWYASGYSSNGNGSAGKNGDAAKPEPSQKGESAPAGGKAAAAGACAGGSCACA